ncbi:jmjC domain-containing protein 4 isoform X1 [Iris pallida]|uniref:JmjC domain-containing protein 4 isoform X1 n=1 Tax=Iris pallida TaxID=29817 RepID=A0AAX6F4V6_IRIPA|nr:jmjC domain-containing protein 4 isoform X1 [Iris pallida]
MGLEIGGEVERINGKEVTYHTFVERFMKKNQPVVITGLMDGWRACTDWVMADGQPNLQFFADRFGKSTVQVADCNTREFTDQRRLEMSVLEFVNHWLELLEGKGSNGFTCSTQSLLYLKDWHFVKEYPEYVAYTTPPFFVDDWLNLYLDSHHMHQDSDVHHDNNEIKCSDYRFVYMGAKGTWTPLHADVFRSYSWSANVCGRKRWLFLPPSKCHHIFDRNFKSSVYDVHSDVSETKFPSFHKAVWLECIQEQNEIIFVPSGWYHQVHNLEDTISINHNWFNGCNLSWVWNLLVKDYNEAKEYIEDIREIADDFEGLCQRNLAANTGMNYYTFFIFLTRFSLANLMLLKNLRNGNDGFRSPSKAQHLITNLVSTRKVASRMRSAEAFAGKNQRSCCSVEDLGASSDIRKFLEDPNLLELCMAVSKAYDTINEGEGEVGEDGSTAAGLRDVGFIESCGSRISTPEDLVRMIDGAISNYGPSFLSDISDAETLAI